MGNVVFSFLNELYLDRGSATGLQFFPLYILVSAVLFALQQRGQREHRRPGGVKGFFAYLFPKDIYFHPSARVDFKMLFLNAIIAASAAFLGFTTGFRATRALAFLHYESQSFTMAALGRPVPFGDMFRLDGLAANLGYALALAMGRDLGRVLVHYPMHKIPALWEIHKYHHNAEVLTPFTAYRLHPIESALSSLSGGLCHGICLFLFVSIFGVEKFTPVTIVGIGVVELWTHSTGVFEHGNKWFSLGRLGFLFANPANHLIHHSTELRHRDKNFANHFAIIDLLLGTLYIPKREEHFRIGVDTAEGRPLVSRSLVRDFYLRPIGEFIGALRRRPAAAAGDATAERNDHAEPAADLAALNCWCGPNCPVLAHPESPQAQPAAAWTSLRDLLPTPSANLPRRGEQRA